VTKQQAAFVAHVQLQSGWLIILVALGRHVGWQAAFCARRDAIKVDLDDPLSKTPECVVDSLFNSEKSGREIFGFEHGVGCCSSPNVGTEAHSCDRALSECTSTRCLC
jgi:hypothetical protein